MSLTQINSNDKNKGCPYFPIKGSNEIDLSSGLTLPPLSCGVGFCRRMCGEDTLPVPSHTRGH